MKRICFIVLFSFLFSLVILPSEVWAGQRFSSPITVVVYGDGLTLGADLPEEQRFARQLENRLKQNDFDVTVISMGREGLLLVDAISEVEGVFGKSPDVVVLQVGETDILRQLSAEFFSENLRGIVNKLRKRGVYVVAMGTLPPPSASKEYAGTIKNIYSGWQGIKNIVPLYPNTLAGISGNHDLTLADGYHPNARGVSVMVSGVYKMVEEGVRWKIGVLNGEQAK